MKISVAIAIVALSVAACNEQPANDAAAPGPSSEPEANPIAGLPPTYQPPLVPETNTVERQTAQSFVNAVTTSDAFEIESSRMALSQGVSEDIKAFAQHMIDAHTKSKANLKQAVNKTSEVLELRGPDPGIKQKLDSLRLLKGTEFDKAYRTEQIAAHENALKTLRDYASSGTDPILKAFANETAPVVDGHLEAAQDLKF